MKKVFVTGSFDILHIGHFKLLEYAKELGDVVWVAIDTDERIKYLKGESRPYHNFRQRMFNLKCIRFVDHVIGFGSDEELIKIIKYLSPDIRMVGEDYLNKKIIGSEYSKEIAYFPRLGSTTEILEKWNQSIIPKDGGLNGGS